MPVDSAQAGPGRLYAGGRGRDATRPMNSFWTFARRILRLRGLLVAALVFAALSAGGMGAGILGMYPILERILPAKGVAAKTLAELLGPTVGTLAGWGVHVPASWMAALPTDPFATVV